MRRRWVVPAVIAAAGTLVLAGSWARQQPPPDHWAGAPATVRAVMWPEPRPVGEFQMQTQHGEPFGALQLRGQWNFMFYGYLQCPDVCPLTLFSMSEFRRLLIEADPAAADHRFLFVSVDTEYDTPEAMAAYLDYFDPTVIGLTGDDAALAKLASSMAVMYQVAHSERGTRSIDHTGSIMVIDPHGRTVAALPPPHDPARMAARFDELRRYLRDR